MFDALSIPPHPEAEPTMLTLEDFDAIAKHIGSTVALVHAERIIEDVTTIVDVYVDDDGLLRQLPLNPVASILAGQMLVGTAVITASSPPNGRIRSVSPPIVRYVEAIRSTVLRANLPPEQQSKAVATPSQEDS